MKKLNIIYVKGDLQDEMLLHEYLCNFSDLSIWK